MGRLVSRVVADVVSVVRSVGLTHFTILYMLLNIFSHSYPEYC